MGWTRGTCARWFTGKRTKFFGMLKRALPVLVASLVLGSAPAVAATTLDPAAVAARTQVTLRYNNGVVVSTANSHESRPALSLVKLYLGYWVLHHGAPEDKARVENMIRYSEDATASDLDRKYPQAIPEVIGQFGLNETHYPGYWGNTTTSTEDLARFTSIMVGDPVAQPIVTGMRTAAPVAADGYKQDYGTSRIPGIIGTKFGWSDARDVNATVSLGNGFVIAANTYGSAADLTFDVLRAVRVTPDGAPSPAPRPDAPATRQPSQLEASILPGIPVQFRDQARQFIRNAEDQVAATQAQACAALAQAGSSGSSQAC